MISTRESEVSLELLIGRRGFLRASFSGMALLAVGAVLPVGCTRYPEPPVELKFFNRQEYAVFQAIARALLGLPEDETFDVAAAVDRLVAPMARSVRRDIRWTLRIFEHGTHLFDLKGKRFTRLSREDQEEYLAGWMESSMGARRLVFRGFKLLAALGAYQRPEGWNEIGYAGPWLGRREADRRFAFEKPVSAGELRISK